MTKQTNARQEQDQVSPDLPPASSGNKERQTRSRLNITHPIRWNDAEIEETYNVRRKHVNTKSELKRLHKPDK